MALYSISIYPFFPPNSFISLHVFKFDLIHCQSIKSVSQTSSAVIIYYSNYYGLPLESWPGRPCTFCFVCDPTRPHIDPGNKKNAQARVGLYLGPIEKFGARPGLVWPVNKIAFYI